MSKPIWRDPAWWIANLWLMFLIFPLTAILTDADRTTGQRVAGTVLIGLFASMHALGYRALVRREQAGLDPTVGSGPKQILDPSYATLWFVLMLCITAVGFGVSGWAMLGVFPFIVSYAMFNFADRAAVATVVVTLGIAIIGPALAGVLDDLWFMAVIIISTAAAAMLVRVTEQHQSEYATLQGQLLVTEERDRVARDVHDVLGHSLTAIVLKAQVVDRLLAEEGDSPTLQEARTHLDEIDAVSRKALTEIRSTVTGLRTADLASELSAARAVLADAGVELVVRGDTSRVPHSAALGWVVREATTNVIRHARARRLEIDLAPAGDVLQMSDDGRGMNGRAEGNGLRGLRERLAEIDLELHVENSNGTRLRVSEPRTTS